MNWKTWGEYLFKAFKSYRLSPGWDQLRGCHDEEDNKSFSVLEKYFKSGQIKPDVWVG